MRKPILMKRKHNPSPKAHHSQRFGAPAAVETSAFHRDAESSEKVWKNPNFTGRAVDMNKVNTYPNFLVNVSRTPWILLDYEKSPDLAEN